MPTVVAPASCICHQASFCSRVLTRHLSDILKASLSPHTHLLMVPNTSYGSRGANKIMSLILFYYYIITTSHSFISLMVSNFAVSHYHYALSFGSFLLLYSPSSTASQLVPSSNGWKNHYGDIVLFPLVWGTGSPTHVLVKIRI